MRKGNAVIGQHPRPLRQLISFAATSPKGRGFGSTRKVHGFAKGSPFEERLPPVRGKMSRSDKKGNLASSARLRGRARLSQNMLSSL